MPKQQWLLASANAALILAAVLTCGSVTDALANGKHHLPSWHAERDFGHGWGWDPKSVTMWDPFGIATVKVTFAVLIRPTVGILVIAP